MGVPGFFAWILKNYKNSKIITSNIKDEIDWLYFDLNCLFHPQCHIILDHYGDKLDLYKLEEKMIKRILNYIDYLIGIANPKKGVFLSVDGVAPMAKMNQQKKRRQKAVQENAARDIIKKKYNKKSATIWNNTTITPGTQFMEKLHQAILSYIKENRIKLNITYIYSSYHTVGEGEHKILQEIKNRNIENNIENNREVYMIYGLDADLIFLSLASGKNKIYLLREETFIRNATHEKTEIVDIVKDVAEDLNYVSIDETKICINDQVKLLLDKKMQLDELENELENEFKYLNINYENVDFTNDFIVLCYFLGNDFISNLPSLDIKNDGLNLILDVYVNTYLTLGHGIIQNKPNDKDFGINMIFLSLFIENLASYEEYYFKIKYPKYLENIARRKCLSDDSYDKEIWEMDNLKKLKLNDPIKLGFGKPDLWKFRYYEYYYGISRYQSDHINNMCEDYLKGIIWTLKYYFDKCPSWEWQYKYINAPFLSDISQFLRNTKYDINKIKFRESNPLTPFTQLLSVLPQTCANLLPPAYGRLMYTDSSPIIDLFPLTVSIDMLYKDSLHKCTPFIPNIDINRILNAVKNIQLNEEEKQRNIVSENYIIKY